MLVGMLLACVPVAVAPPLNQAELRGPLYSWCGSFLDCDACCETDAATDCLSNEPVCDCPELIVDPICPSECEAECIHPRTWQCQVETCLRRAAQDGPTCAADGGS